MGMAPPPNPDQPDTTSTQLTMVQPRVMMGMIEAPMSLLRTNVTYQGIGWTRTPEQQKKHERRVERQKAKRNCPWYNKHR